jgi:hypothetical protein
VHLLDSGLPCQRGGGGRVVASEHGDGVAVAAQPGHDLGGLRAQLVAHGDGADDLSVVLDDHGGGRRSGAAE